MYSYAASTEGDAPAYRWAAAVAAFLGTVGLQAASAAATARMDKVKMVDYC